MCFIFIVVKYELCRWIYNFIIWGYIIDNVLYLNNLFLIFRIIVYIFIGVDDNGNKIIFFYMNVKCLGWFCLLMKLLLNFLLN